MNLVSDRRNESLEVGYRAMLECPQIAGRVTFTLDEFKKGCEGFDVYGFFSDEPAGMVFLDKDHPHIAILKKYQGRCGKVIKQALSLLLSKSSILVADVHNENHKAINFVERIGFRYKEENGNILTYTLGD